MRLIDLTGKVFGRLTVIRRAENTPRGLPRWLCLCECGTLTVVIGSDLRGHRTKSCGCFRRDSTKEKATTHGMSKTPVHNAWCRMKARCGNQKSKDYEGYGGRGISVCERWRDSFENFYADMGPKPEGLSIDRIDNNGNYTPENCRWATRKQQANNKRANRLIEYRGVSRNITQWAELLELPPYMLRSRLRRGWPVGEVLGLEFRKPREGRRPNGQRAPRLVSYNGTTRTLAEWAVLQGIKKPALFQRLRARWPIGEALGLEPHKHGLAR